MTAATESLGVSQVFLRPPMETLFKDCYFVSGSSIVSGSGIGSVIGGGSGIGMIQRSSSGLTRNVELSLNINLRLLVLIVFLICILYMSFTIWFHELSRVYLKPTSF